MQLGSKLKKSRKARREIKALCWIVSNCASSGWGRWAQKCNWRRNKIYNLIVAQVSQCLRLSIYQSRRSQPTVKSLGDNHQSNTHLTFADHCMHEFVRLPLKYTHLQKRGVFASSTLLVNQGATDLIIKIYRDLSIGIRPWIMHFFIANVDVTEMRKRKSLI